MPGNVPVSAQPTTYVSVPTSVTAMQWTGENINDLWDWVGADKLFGPLPAGDELRPEGAPARLWVQANHVWLELEVGEWIIQDTLGFYPCKDSVFQRKYQKAPSAAALTELLNTIGEGPRA